MGFIEQIDIVIEYMSQSNKPPSNFNMLYFYQPDEFSHAYGPNSKKVKRNERKIFVCNLFI